MCDTISPYPYCPLTCTTSLYRWTTPAYTLALCKPLCVLERLVGIEPTSSAWKAVIISHYTIAALFLAGPSRIELQPSPVHLFSKQGSVQPRLEPTGSSYWIRTSDLHHVRVLRYQLRQGTIKNTGSVSVCLLLSQLSYN